MHDLADIERGEKEHPDGPGQQQEDEQPAAPDRSREGQRRERGPRLLLRRPDQELRHASARIPTAGRARPARRSRTTTTTARPAAGTDPRLRASECNAEDIRSVELIQTSDADALDRLLERAAALLRECSGRLLGDGHDAFVLARAIRSQRAAAYTAELRNRGVLEEADAAWKQKDYGRVHDLLNPIGDSLGPSDQRRLEFAEKKL